MSNTVVTEEMISAVAWSPSHQEGVPWGMLLNDEQIGNILNIGLANAPAALQSAADTPPSPYAHVRGGVSKADLTKEIAKSIEDATFLHADAARAKVSDQEQAIKAICAAVVLGYDEQEKPVHLSAEEARKAIAAYQSVLTPEPCGCDSSKVNVRPYPDILSEDENKSILGDAESLWRDLQGNRLGGYSGGNRPFYILHAFKAVIEKYGRRDVGLSWSKNDLENPSPSPNLTASEADLQARLRMQFRVGYNTALEEAANVAYRVCAETRHVTLGDKAADAIRALAASATEDGR